MTKVLVQEAAAVRIEELYKYSAAEWGEAQAENYINGLFEAFDNISTGALVSHPVPAEFGVDGYFFRYRKHYVYWKKLNSGTIGIVTVLHERMHQLGRLLEDREL